MLICVFLPIFPLANNSHYMVVLVIIMITDTFEHILNVR